MLRGNLNASSFECKANYENSHILMKDMLRCGFIVTKLVNKGMPKIISKSTRK